YRSRDEALFADDLPGGQVLAAGVVASISIEARGRMLRANVAGVPHPWYETLDDRGGLSMVVRGGVALLRSFQLNPIPRETSGTWLWSGLAAGIAAFLLALSGKSAFRVFIALAFMPLVAWSGSSLALELLLPEIRPAELTLLGLALAGLPLSVLLALRFGVINIVLALLLMGGAWYLALQNEGRERLASSEDARLTEYFGPDSGLGPMDALTRRFHSESRVHRLAEEATRIFFLGGGDLFEPWPRSEPRPAGYLTLQVELELSRDLGRKVESVVVPGELALGKQQLQLVERFYLEDYEPGALVFAVTRSTVGPGEDFGPALRSLLDDLERMSELSQAKVLILGSELLPAEQTDLLRGSCQDRGWPLVRGLLGAEPSKRLVSELETELATLLR
ncbi:MAG: hypothetical protein ACYTG5_12365, partial [Planctomycetota bacterium]